MTSFASEVFFAQYSTWRKRRQEIFKKLDIQSIDKDHAIKKQAGIDRLNDFGFESEVEMVCSIFNVTMFEYFELNDIYVTRLLQFKKISNNFEQKFSELKLKKAKQGRK